MEELYINGIKIDLKENTIAQTKQINDLGDLKDRQANYSNNIKIPMTPDNMLTFELLGITGSTTRKPYEANNIKYVVDGIELIVNGRGTIKSTDSYYNLVIYDGNIEMVDLLGDATLSDLDFTAYNHNLSRSLWLSSQNNTSGYIYPYGNYNGKVGGDPISGGVIYIDLQLVCFYVHTLFDMIFAQKGYTITGDIFTDSDYKSRVTTVNIGYDRTPSGVVIPINFNLLFGTTKQTDFVKDIMQRFGLMFRKVKMANEFEFVKYNDLLSDFNNADDWSGKYSNFLNESYTAPYSQANKMKYLYSENSNTKDFADGNLYIDNVNLPETNDLFTSIFTATEPQFFSNIETTNFWELNDLVYDVKEDGLRLFKLSTTNGLFVYDFTPDGTGTSSSTFTLRYLDFTSDLHFDNEILNYYSGIKSAFDDYKKITIECNLTLLDIYELDFFKLKYFEQLGRYYYLNKISNFKPYKKTKVELIQAVIGGVATPSYNIFESSSLSFSTSILACSDTSKTRIYYHNGVGYYPTIGDTVYYISLGTYFTLDGMDKYWRLGISGEVIENTMLVNSSGVVTNIVAC